MFTILVGTVVDGSTQSIIMSAHIITIKDLGRQVI